VTVSSAGFQTEKLESAEFTSRQKLRVNVTHQVGQVSQEVEVTASRRHYDRDRGHLFELRPAEDY
jgi:hypothetical protein